MRKHMGLVCLLFATLALTAACSGGDGTAEDVGTGDNALCTAAHFYYQVTEAWEQPGGTCGVFWEQTLPTNFDLSRQVAFAGTIASNPTCYWNSTGMCSSFQRNVLKFNNTAHCYNWPDDGELEVDLVLNNLSLNPAVVTVRRPSCASTYKVSGYQYTR